MEAGAVVETTVAADVGCPEQNVMFKLFLYNFKSALSPSPTWIGRPVISFLHSSYIFRTFFDQAIHFFTIWPHYQWNIKLWNSKRKLSQNFRIILNCQASYMCSVIKKEKWLGWKMGETVARLHKLCDCHPSLGPHPTLQ